jgi:hypothetical protein
MYKGKSTPQKPPSILRQLRTLWIGGQAGLKAQYKEEIKRIAPGDVVMSTRIKHKYRKLGLKF